MLATITQKPIVSVVIPTRDNLENLRHAVESVFIQGVSPIELIIVNDDSHDGATEWLENLARQKPIRLINVKVHNRAKARNFGIQAATAPLIAFLDDDDVWRAGKLHRQLAAHAADPKLTFSFTNYELRGRNGQEYGTGFDYWRVETQEPSFQRIDNPCSTLLGRNLVATSTVMARRNALIAVGGFDAQLTGNEEWDLWLSLAALGPTAWSSFIGADYRKHRVLATCPKRKRLEAMRAVVKNHAPGIRCRWSDKLRLFARAQINEAEALLQERHPIAAAAHHLLAGLVQADRHALRRCAADLTQLMQA